MNIILILLALIAIAFLAWYGYHFIRLAILALSVVMWMVAGGTSFYRAKRAK